MIAYSLNAGHAERLSERDCEILMEIVIGARVRECDPVAQQIFMDGCMIAARTGIKYTVTEMAFDCQQLFLEGGQNV